MIHIYLSAISSVEVPTALLGLLWCLWGCKQLSPPLMLVRDQLRYFSQLVRQLPHDFLYPFFISNTASLFYYNKVLLILLNIIFIMLRIEDCSLHVLVSDLTTYPAYNYTDQKYLELTLCSLYYLGIFYALSSIFWSLFHLGMYRSLNHKENCYHESLTVCVYIKATRVGQQ